MGVSVMADKKLRKHAGLLIAEKNRLDANAIYGASSPLIQSAEVSDISHQESMRAQSLALPLTQSIEMTPRRRPRDVPLPDMVQLQFREFPDISLLHSPDDNSDDLNFE